MATTIPYNYKNLPINGGGYVTGFSIHPKVPGILYARTDIGGVYRYLFKENAWESLADSATHEDLASTFPLAIALDANDASRLYMVCGLGRLSGEDGWFYRSDDYGHTFERFPLPCKVHGNNPGRGTGKRLIVDPTNSDIIYFASQSAGLLRSTDRGQTWVVIDVSTPSHPYPEKNLCFLFLSDDASIMLVACNGEANKLTEDMRGPSLYVSYNKGNTFRELKQPKVIPGDYTSPMGYVGHRYAFTGRYLFVTMNHTVPGSYFRWDGYSCDSARMIGGKVIRYELSGGQLMDATDVTPVFPQYGISPSFLCECGFGGICVSPAVPGRVLVSTLNHNKGGEIIFESYDNGDSWKVNLRNLEEGNIRFNTSYMKPEYNGGGSPIHWLTDLCADPFDPNLVWFNSGLGVFMTNDLWNSHYHWEDSNKGLEETVHLGVYAPTGGRCAVLDACGDLGGFAFTNVDEPCDNTFCDRKQDRYLTALNCDYVDQYPNIMVAGVRGNWTGKTRGGVIHSTNGGARWEELPLPTGLSPQIDRLLERICHPNCNSGWVSISADGESIVWAISYGQKLPVEAMVMTKDGGETYKRCRVADRNGVSMQNAQVKPFADRTDPKRFYCFDSNGGMYASMDGGESFFALEVPTEFPGEGLTGIDARFTFDIRGVSGEVGLFYIALGKKGLWKLKFIPEEKRVLVRRVSKADESVYAVGLGIAPGSTDYITGAKVLFIAGNIAGQYGFYRSQDAGGTWTRINRDDQCYGQIISIDGDKKIPGRFYLATGSRGLLYGDEA